eukprot:6209705-Pleurochrysis_carterae.AAC.1
MKPILLAWAPARLSRLLSSTCYGGPLLPVLNGLQEQALAEQRGARDAYARGARARVHAQGCAA